MLPQIFKARNHRSWDGAMTQADDGKYIPARCFPLYRNPIQNLLTRVALAYGVLTGRYDALDWK
jgi:hypothetical protein